MVKLEKKQVKIISVLIAIVFIGSVVALALTQSGSGIASAASSNVGVVDYNQIMSQHPQVQAASTEMQQAVQDAQKEFESKAANMNDQEKHEQQQSQSSHGKVLLKRNRFVSQQLPAAQDTRGVFFKQEAAVIRPETFH